jgi:hypothetical protein
MATTVSKLKEVLEGQERTARARFEARLGRELSDDEWLEVHRRRVSKTWRRTKRRALTGVPKRLQTEANLRRFERVPLHVLAETILAADRGLIARPCGARRSGPRTRRSRVGSRARSRSPGRLADDDSDDDDDVTQFRANARAAGFSHISDLIADELGRLRELT